MFIIGIVTLAFCLSGGACYAETATSDHSSREVIARAVEPLPTSQGNIYTLSKIKLQGIHLSSNDLVTDDELDLIVGRYKGKDISFEQLEEIRQELIRIIIGKGYVNSGVIIPDQQVKDGVISFTVISGQLTRVELTGNRYFSTDYLRSRLERGALQPLNVTILQENLQLLQADPRIKTINAELAPGEKSGESVLKTRIEEKNPLTLRVEAANNDPPSTGAYRGDVIASYSNLMGVGDSIEGRFGITEGNLDYGARLRAPLNSHDTTMEAYFRRGENTVIEDLHRKLDIKSKDDTYGLRISQPIIFDLSHQLTVSLAGEYRTSATSMLGEEYSLSAGAVDGKSRLTALRFGQEYIYRAMDHVLALSSCLSFGVNVLGATINDDGQPDGRFFSWLAQALYIMKIGETEAVFRSDAQLSNDQLLSMEKFSIGGNGSVRGYRKSLFVRDNGVSGALELRVPIFSNGKGEQVLSLIPFYDFGYAWDNHDVTGQQNSFIQSIGGGFKWSPFSNVAMEFYYGFPLRHISQPDKDPQDYGIHFNVSWQIL